MFKNFIPQSRKNIGAKSVDPDLTAPAGAV